MLSDSVDEKINEKAYKIFKKVFLPNDNFWKDLDRVAERVDDRVKNKKSRIEVKMI